MSVKKEPTNDDGVGQFVITHVTDSSVSSATITPSVVEAEIEKLLESCSVLMKFDVKNFTLASSMKLSMVISRLQKLMIGVWNSDKFHEAIYTYYLQHLHPDWEVSLQHDTQGVDIKIKRPGQLKSSNIEHKKSTIDGKRTNFNFAQSKTKKETLMSWKNKTDNGGWVQLDIYSEDAFVRQYIIPGPVFVAYYRGYLSISPRPHAQLNLGAEFCKKCKHVHRITRILSYANKWCMSTHKVSLHTAFENGLITNYEEPIFSDFTYGITVAAQDNCDEYRYPLPTDSTHGPDNYWMRADIENDQRVKYTQKFLQNKQ